MRCKSLGEIKFDSVDDALDAAHHQKVLIAQPVEVQTQWRCLELDLASQHVVLQHISLCSSLSGRRRSYSDLNSIRHIFNRFKRQLQGRQRLDHRAWSIILG
jgi:hypothetical protein